MKRFHLCMFLFICMFFLISCDSYLKFTDFSGLSDLTKNPSRLVFGTNSMNFNDEDGIYGEPLEYELKTEKYEEIVKKMFAVKYQGLPKIVEIDISPIIRYLLIYDENGNIWKVELGLRRHNERWYDPINDQDLIDLLYEAVVYPLGTFYTLQESYDSGQLTTENLQNIKYYHERLISVTPTGLTISIEKSIKETRAFDLRRETYSNGFFKQPEASADDVTVIGYYGWYEDCFAVMLQDSYYDYTEAESSVNIAGVVFNYSNGNSILIWQENSIIKTN